MNSQGIQESQKRDLLTAVRRAGELLLELWPGGSSIGAALEIKTKGDGSLVSLADLRSNELITNVITELFPSDALLSEETEPDNATLAAARRTWIIDPLDGTAAFLAGRDDFSILVALCEDQIPTFGVMLFPARGQMIIAEHGKGATVNGAPLAVSRNQLLSQERVYIRNFECTRPELSSPAMDSGLAFLKVACGELDGAIIKMSTHREWDIAAPLVVISEANGLVSDETGAVIRCGSGQISYRYVVASNGINHKELLALIPR